MTGENDILEAMIEVELLIKYQSYQSAIELLEQILAASPTYLSAKEALEAVFRKVGDLEKANEMAREITSLREQLVHTIEFLEEDPDRLQKRRLTEKMDNLIREIYGSSDLASILRTSARKFVENLDVDRCLMITLKQENGLARSYEYCREGIPSSQDGKTAKLNWLLLKKFSRGMEPLVIDETQKDPLLIESLPALEEFNIQSLIVYPLVYESSFIGLVMLHRCGKSVRWNDQEITLFSTVVEHMAVAISNAQQLNAIQTLAVTDTLTGLYNRRCFEERLSAELRNAQQQRYPMCLALLDIDYFKKINDTFGHPVGDRALQKLGLLLQTNLRKGTVVARFGGEEFAVILPNMSLQTAHLIMEKIRKLVESSLATDSGSSITISVGVTETYSQNQRELTAIQEELIRKADKNLYHAKRSGRNQVCVDLVQTAEVGRS